MYTDYRPGDIIHILPYNTMGNQTHLNQEGKMEPWYDTIATVRENNGRNAVRIEEDKGCWLWHYKNIEPAPSVVMSMDVHELVSFL